MIAFKEAGRCLIRLDILRLVGFAVGRETGRITGECFARCPLSHLQQMSSGIQATELQI